jgi:hypothetical protein
MNKAMALLIAGGALAVMMLAAIGPTAAQSGRYVQLAGQVQWIAGQKLMLLTDGGGGVDVDIARVPLDQYRTLTQGDRVIVGGVVSPDNRRVFANVIARDTRWDYQGP